MTSPAFTPAEAMNRMYRLTRHVYDASRRYYLLGRDRLIDRIARDTQGAVLEIGCGTARNLIALHQKAPHLVLYGLDAADVMLKTAQGACERAGCADRIRLAQGLAEAFDARDAFGRARPFDVIFFSYVLSMTPAWRAALEAAVAHLRPGGRLYIVDFWDQAALPNWFGVSLQRWLALFEVRFQPALHRHLHVLGQKDVAAVTIEPVARRYAYLATVQYRPSTSAGACDASLASGYDVTPE